MNHDHHYWLWYFGLQFSTTASHDQPDLTLWKQFTAAFFFFSLFNRDNIKFECYLQTQSKCTALQLKSSNLRTPTVAMDHQKHGLAGFLTHWIQFKEENGFKWVEGLWPWKTVPSWKWTLMWSEQEGGDKHSRKHESHSHTWWLPWWESQNKHN